MKKAAFTMIELVMVIVVLGILAALAMPRMDRDLRQEAGDNILSAIRYTQHLALMDNKTDPNNPNWQQTLWTIQFMNAGNEWFYRVASNMDNNNNLDLAEAAIDPSNGKYMHSTDASPAGPNESPDIFLTAKYGVTNVDFTNCSGAVGDGNTIVAVGVRHIAFDYLGRPHRGVVQGGTNDFHTLLHTDCSIQFTFSDNTTMDIIIRQQTGYANIVGQPNS